MPGPRISVVVPVYNNQAQLEQCLASIAAQTFGDLEVIVVDDGSTDASPAIASARAAADRRFTVLTVPNGGPGAARNRGVQAASGEFLAFADADDLLPPGAYAAMLQVLERTGSDFVSGGVQRLTESGLGESGLHVRAIKAERDRTHIASAPELLYDISVFNKLFRRSFWDAAGLAFPEGMVWEDLVAMTRAHVLARAVDVITEPVYRWRDRDQGAPSITQSRTDIANFADRVTALEMIDDFLREHGTARMLRRHQHKALVNDLWLYVGDLSATSPQYQAEFIRLGRRYLAGVSRKVIASLPAGHKLAYHLIEQGLGNELAGFAAWRAGQPGKTPPMIRSFGRLRADLPFRRDRRLKIPARVFAPQWRELDPFVQVEAIGWQDGRLVIVGCAHIPSVDISKRRHATKIIVFRPAARRGLPVVAVARSVRHPAATASSGRQRYGYQWAGFRCEVGARRFRTGRRWLPGSWDCFVLVRGRGVWRPARLHTPAPGAERPAAWPVGSGLTLAPVWAGRRLRIVLRPSGPPGAGDAAAGGRAAADSAAAVESWPATDATPATDGGPAAEPAAAGNGSVPVIDGYEWTRDGRLAVRGRIPAARPGGWELLLRRSPGGEQQAIPLRRDGDSFSAAFDVAAVPVFGDRVPLRDGCWHVLARAAPGQPAQPDGPAQAELLRPSLSPAVAAPGSRRVIIGNKAYQCVVLQAGEPVAAARAAGRGTADGGPVLAVTAGPALSLAERGRIRRRLLRRLYYPLQRLLPLRDCIVFVSFGGKQCGDNPRGIADELRRRGDGRSHVWVVSDWSVPVPDGSRAVLAGSPAYFAAVGRCRYLVANDHMPRPFRKRAGQRYVQTWHGAPLKRIGYDVAVPSSASGAGYLAFMAGDVAQWDLLLSPNPFSTPILRRAFRYGGEICESGYPRNDVLYGAGAADRAGQVRRRLGLEPGKRVALYAPTWRDDQHDAAGRYRLDFALDLTSAAERLAARYMLLIRAHHLMESGLPAGLPPGFAVDVTGYPDISDLLLVTDVLITDYSSVIFDFAPAARPILFFAYDLAAYRDRLRGFSFDFEAEAPGPVLASSADVVAALAGLDSKAAGHSAASAAFARRYCPLEDGKSAVRACDRIFGG